MSFASLRRRLVSSNVITFLPSFAFPSPLSLLKESHGTTFTLGESRISVNIAEDFPSPAATGAALSETDTSSATGLASPSFLRTHAQAH